MKTLETIAKNTGSRKITEVSGTHGWTDIDLKLTAENIVHLNACGIRRVCVGAYEFPIAELVGLPDAEFQRIGESTMKREEIEIPEELI